MDLSKYLNKETIIMDMQAENKTEAITELFTMVENTQSIINKKGFLDDIFAREDLMSTGIGHNVAIPHARSSNVKKFVVALGISKKGVDFEALDGQPVNIFFLMGSPADERMSKYLQFLAHLNRLLQKLSFREAILSAEDEQSLIKLFKKT